MTLEKLKRRTLNRPDAADEIQPRNKKARKNWQMDAAPTFRCCACRQMVFSTPEMGTKHRNHCPFCLCSKHVDTKPGNRKATCHGRMAPLGLTLKRNGYDKYGKPRQGDVMLVHRCTACGLLNLNRIAADDSTYMLKSLLQQSLGLNHTLKQHISCAGIQLLQDADALHVALFGKQQP